MPIISAEEVNEDANTFKVDYDNGRTLFVPNSLDNTQYVELQEWLGQGNSVIAWQWAPSLQEAKDKKIAEIKAQAFRFLKETDWMVLRELEGGTTKLTSVTTWRAALRTSSNTEEIAINALTTIDDVKNHTTIWPKKV